MKRRTTFICIISAMMLIGCGTTVNVSSIFELPESSESSSLSSKSHVIKSTKTEVSDSSSQSPKRFGNVTMDDATFEYDGKYHTIEPNNVPSFATVKYIGTNSYKDPSTEPYTIKARVTAEGYSTLELEAKLTIVGHSFEGITFEDETVEYDGYQHTIYPKNVPSDATVEALTQTRYTNINENGYTISYRIKKDGYYPLTLSAKLYIVGKSFEGIYFPDRTLFFTDENYEISVVNEQDIPYTSKTLPRGTTVQYECTNKSGITNVIHDVGTYKIKATLSNSLGDYRTTIYEATITIIDTMKYVGVDDSKNQFTFDKNVKYKELIDELDKGNFSLEISAGDIYENVQPAYADQFVDHMDEPRCLYADGSSFLDINFDHHPASTYGEVIFGYSKDGEFRKLYNNAYGESVYGGNYSSFGDLLLNGSAYYLSHPSFFFKEGTDGEFVPDQRKASGITYITDTEFAIENNEFKFTYRAKYVHPELTHYEVASVRFYNIGNTKVDVPEVMKR